MKSYLFLLLFAVSCTTSYSQEPVPAKKQKGSLYFCWGYNRDWYSKSDLHFKNTSGDYNPVTGRYDSYDFTIYDATARDRSEFHKMLRVDLTIPQYNYRLGYYFNNMRDLGIEISFDHAKYIVRDWQTLHVKGYIGDDYIDKDTMISPENFLHFEHTDGANFLMLNFIKRQNLLHTKNGRQKLNAVAKIGFGPVIPRTDVTLFGQELNNCFHIAGYCAGVETGLRYDTKYIFVEYAAKGLFANYRNVLVIGAGKAYHHFWAFENILTLGFQFPI